jgi:hypothetical protein
MRKLMITGLAVGFIALVVYSRAQAAPPEEGQYRQFNEPIIACDTSAEIDEVVQAIKDSKLPEKLKEFHEKVDEHSEPVCIYASEILSISDKFTIMIERLILGKSMSAIRRPNSGSSGERQ